MNDYAYTMYEVNKQESEKVQNTVQGTLNKCTSQ